MPHTVSGYSGPLPLDPITALLSWRFGAGTVSALGLAAAYLLGVHRMRSRGVGWPAGRVWCFVVGGAGTLLLATSGFVGVYAGTLFWVRAAQNVTLLMVTPMLCALGAPLTLVAEFLPTRVRRALGRALRSRPARAVSFPLVVTVVFVAPLPLIYLSPLYPASLASPRVGAMVGLGLLAAGWVYFWTRFRVDPVPREDSYLVSLGISVVEVLLDGALGLVVWLGPLLAGPYYEALGRPWGPTLRLDQIIGAGVLWIGGDLVGLPFLGVVLRRMSREDAREAVIVDAALDRQELDREELLRETPAGDDEPAPRLWWEDHPELAERFQHR